MSCRQPREPGTADPQRPIRQITTDDRPFYERKAEGWFWYRELYQRAPQAESFEGPVWEPARGDGAIARELSNAGLDVVATDLNDRGHGRRRVDFLMEYKPLGREIVTNPPYSLANEFIRHALSLRADKVVMLMRLAFLEGIKRSDIIDNAGLARVHVFRERLIMVPKGVSITGNGDGAIAWFVWERGHAGPITLSRISTREAERVDRISTKTSESSSDPPGFKESGLVSGPRREGVWSPARSPCAPAPHRPIQPEPSCRQMHLWNDLSPGARISARA